MAWAIPSIIVVMTAGVLLPCALTFDRLVKREHDLYSDAWEADGRPQGMFWRPGGGWFSFVLFGSGRAANRCMRVWPFRTPHWARGDHEAMRLLRRLRRLLIAWSVGIVVFVVAVLYIRAVG
jgi:hypothetical protein